MKTQTNSSIAKKYCPIVMRAMWIVDLFSGKLGTWNMLRVLIRIVIINVKAAHSTFDVNIINASFRHSTHELNRMAIYFQTDVNFGGEF